MAAHSQNIARPLAGGRAVFGGTIGLLRVGLDAALREKHAPLGEAALPIERIADELPAVATITEATDGSVSERRTGSDRSNPSNHDQDLAFSARFPQVSEAA